MSKHRGAASVGANLQSQRSFPDLKSWIYKKRSGAQTAAGVYNKWVVRSKERPLSYAVCARDAARKGKGFCTTARPKVARIETLGKPERASVVERGNTLTGVKGISEVVNRSLSREYVEMVDIDDGCVDHIAERFVVGMLWVGDVDRKLGRLSHPGSQDA